MGKHGKWMQHDILCECEECLSHKFPRGRHDSAEVAKLTAEQVTNMTIKDVLPKESRSAKPSLLKRFLRRLEKSRKKGA
jgi:hypothetical protein